MQKPRRVTNYTTRDTDGWIGVDLDGTLAHYPPSILGAQIGEPIEAMVLRVRGWLARGKRVKIMTARAAHDTDLRYVREWCQKHVHPDWVAEVTCVKDYMMEQLWDDRAVQVLPNTGRTVSDEFEARYHARHGKVWTP